MRSSDKVKVAVGTFRGPVESGALYASVSRHGQSAFGRRPGQMSMGQANWKCVDGAGGESNTGTG